jgi:Ni/Fe-hydrogenase 1 B-type cytochrome subunit
VREADGVPGEELIRVYVWDLPVRILHWTIVAMIACLTLSGLYIAHPLIAVHDPGLSLMANIRLAHIVCGCILSVAVVARIVWAFFGNPYGRWRQFLPVTRERRAQIVPSLKYYGFLRKEPPAVVGHNPLAALIYVALYALLVVQALTGFALEAMSARGGWLWMLTGWVFQIASSPTIELVHYVITFLVLGFVINHVYSSLLVESEEHSGLISSIVTGWKNVPKERV